MSALEKCMTDNLDKQQPGVQMRQSQDEESFSCANLEQYLTQKNALPFRSSLSSIGGKIK